MRTITENLKNRLLIQAGEAKQQNLVKVAINLDSIIDQPTRLDHTPYTYSNDEFEQDVEKNIWNAVVRFADFHNIDIDANKAQDIVEKVAKDLILELRAKTGTDNGMGAFEPTVPGEEKKTVVITVEE